MYLLRSHDTSSFKIKLVCMATYCVRYENFSLQKQNALFESGFPLKCQLKSLFSCFLGLIQDFDDLFNLMNPKSFIFDEKDDLISLHQIC